MGRERDYGSEYHKSSNNYPRYKFRGGSKRIGKKVPRKQPEPLIPVDDDFYTPGEASAEADRVLAQPYTFPESKTTKQPQSQPQQPSPKRNWLGRLFGAGNEPSTQSDTSQTLKQKNASTPNKQHSNNRYAAPRSVNLNRQDSPAVENFQQRLRNRANSKLDENKQQVYQLSAAYNANDPKSKPLFNELRAVVTQDGQLEAQQKQLERELAVISNDPAMAGESPAMGGSIRVDPHSIAQLTTQLQQIKQVRATLLANYPVSGLIEAHQVGDDVSDAQIEDILTYRFAGINRDIDVAQEKISNGDIPLNELDALIPEILASTPEGQRAEVEQYLKKQQRIDTAISVGGTLGEIGLTAGAIVSGILSGGVITTILAGLGTALGIGTATYEFERASDLNLIAKTGDAGGNQLLTQPDRAKQDYLLGWANLVLASIDGGLAISEGAQVLDSLKAAEFLAGRSGSSAIFSVPQDKVLQIQRAIDLERAGDPTAASTLFALRKELGGSKFDGVYDTLSDSNLRVIDNAEAAKIKGRGLETNEVDPAVLNKWLAKYPNAVLEADGQLVKLNNQIKIHPSKLDEVDEATINKIVNSTQELDAVGGDITKLSPETRQDIKDLTSTNGGRWRFEYQTNGIVNQYLDYVGLKEHSIFQNMSDAEKKRLFDIPNQMNYLDEVPANAKRKQSKLKTKAQEKMIEQQAASYAIQQNPQDATEFVNYTEFYKTQMKQRIANLEEQYAINLEAAIDEIAKRDKINANLNVFTTKQIEEANQNASQKLFGEELYSEEVAFKNENAAKKYFKKTVYENAGVGNNFEQLTPQIRDEIQEIYQAKIANIGSDIGEFQIAPNLSSEKIIEEIQTQADHIKFDNETAAIYHTEKHYDEFPPSHKTEDNKFNNYWQSAIETTKKSQNITFSHEQLDSSRSFIFKHTYEEGGKSYHLQTIVGVSQDGIVNIKTYFNFVPK